MVGLSNYIKNIGAIMRAVGNTKIDIYLRPPYWVITGHYTKPAILKRKQISDYHEHTSKYSVDQGTLANITCIFRDIDTSVNVAEMVDQYIQECLNGNFRTLTDYAVGTHNYIPNDSVVKSMLLHKLYNVPLTVLDNLIKLTINNSRFNHLTYRDYVIKVLLCERRLLALNDIIENHYLKTHKVILDKEFTGVLKLVVILPIAIISEKVKMMDMCDIMTLANILPNKLLPDHLDYILKKSNNGMSITNIAKNILTKWLYSNNTPS